MSGNSMTARCKCCRRTLPAFDCRADGRCHTCAAICSGPWGVCAVREQIKAATRPL
jgi:hypothetical protein